MISSGPGKAIIFGEHAVVYDKLGIVGALNKRCNVEIFPSNKGKVSITSSYLNLSSSWSRQKIFDIAGKVSQWQKEKNFERIKKAFNKDKLLPSFFVIARIFQKHHIFQGFDINVNSEVPNNLGSSSALFSALACGTLSCLGQPYSREDISQLAFQGDIIAHGGTPSGIDNNAVVYGGYLTYQRTGGIKKLDVAFDFPVLIVDSGQRAETAKTVSLVRERRKRNKGFVDSVLDSLDDISHKALKAMYQADLEKIGALMFNYYRELKKLDISTKKLDKIISLALVNGALGAKPTGGWGGGNCLVLLGSKKDAPEFSHIFKKQGFNSFLAETDYEGVKILS